MKFRMLFTAVLIVFPQFKRLCNRGVVCSSLCIFFSIKVDHERQNSSLLRKNLKFTKERYHSTENMLGMNKLGMISYDYLTT